MNTDFVFIPLLYTKKDKIKYIKKQNDVEFEAVGFPRKVRTYTIYTWYFLFFVFCFFFLLLTIDNARTYIKLSIIIVMSIEVYMCFC
jgi:hypothetical protein